MRCAIWYHLYNLKNLKNTNEGVFFTFFKLYKWYQIAQRIKYQLYIFKTKDYFFHVGVFFYLTAVKHNKTAHN